MASALEDPQSPVRKLTRATTEVIFGKAKSIRATVMQLTTCTLGAGILTLPFALSCFGLGLGLITLVFNSAFALLCSFFLSMACTLRALRSNAALRADSASPLTRVPLRPSYLSHANRHAFGRV